MMRFVALYPISSVDVQRDKETQSALLGGGLKPRREGATSRTPNVRHQIETTYHTYSTVSKISPSTLKTDDYEPTVVLVPYSSLQDIAAFCAHVVARLHSFVVLRVFAFGLGLFLWGSGRGSAMVWSTSVCCTRARGVSHHLTYPADALCFGF